MLNLPITSYISQQKYGSDLFLYSGIFELCLVEICYHIGTKDLKELVQTKLNSLQKLYVPVISIQKESPAPDKANESSQKSLLTFGFVSHQNMVGY